MYYKCDLTWFMSWNYDCKMILIWTLLRSKTNSWLIRTLLFRCINYVCVLASTPGSDIWASWCRRVSHAKLLGPLFSSQMRCAKINCERSAAKAKWKGELLQTRATVNMPGTPNFTVLKRINRSTFQMMTVTKGEERLMAEQLKVWPSSDCQSPIKLMVWNLTDTSSALDCAISHPGDLLGTSRALPLDINSFALCWGADLASLLTVLKQVVQDLAPDGGWSTPFPKNVMPLEGKSDKMSLSQSWWVLLAHAAFQVFLFFSIYIYIKTTHTSGQRHPKTTSCHVGRCIGQAGKGVQMSNRMHENRGLHVLGQNNLPFTVIQLPVVMLMVSLRSSERKWLLLFSLRHHRRRSDGAEVPPQPHSFLLCYR